MATRDIANGGAGLSACGAIALFGLPGKVFGAYCAVAGAAIVTQANRAKNRNMCLKIKYVRLGSLGIWPGIYSGGHCR